MTPRVSRLLSKARACRSIGERMAALSEALVGLPYVTGPLTGTASTPEVFTAALDGFDCVTYMETVLALALSEAAEDFPAALGALRYQDGRVEWRRRHHYMTGWIRANARAGFVRPLPGGALAVRRERLLSAVPGLPARRVRLSCVPKRSVARWQARFETGDLIFFATARRDLDVFHCGILVKAGERWRLRHAARSRGGVVEQDLDEFLKAYRMPGVMVARPLAGERGAAR